MATAVYHANFRATEVRTHGRPDSVTFAAADDATAEVIAGIIDAATDSKMVSLMTRYKGDHLAVDHPVGTHEGWWAIGRAADGTICKFRLRNLVEGNALIYSGIAHLLTNNFTAEELAEGFQALAAAPKLPNSGQTITSASVAFTGRT